MLDFAIKVLTARTGQTHLFAVGQAGYIVKSSSGQLLAIDLYLSNCVERLEGHKGFKRLLPSILSSSDLNFDAVVCTHPHLDHFDVDAVPEMVSKGAKLFCSVECEKLIHQLQMEYYKDSITYVKPQESYGVGDFHITFVSCDHGTSAPDAVGVVVKVDGKTIYETGDSCLRLDRIGEIPQPLDILVAPINGMYGNMNSEDVVNLAEILHPAVTVPCHYGMFASHGGDLKAFYDLMTANKLPFLLMRQGEQYTF
ncbi:MAG: MBL fold metallo-hydrolase [Hungatella sp.]|jgi:L-ascorbate 6-phosphate lactonase|nr:MBL fold metallo-hydrolase [Hungatella sp.]